jgi:predicted MFS family arabinose efflux permease
VDVRVRGDFAKLWAGQTVSEVCSRITREGLPLTALLTLHANAAQMGVLSAISSAAVFVFSLGAGVVVDRLKKRPLMIATDLARAALLLLVPLAAFQHMLSITSLMIIAALAGTLTVLFDVAYQSYLPVLVEPDELLPSNKRLSISSSAAEMLGPALAGVLVQAVTAPMAILLDALSFLVSAFSLWVIRKPEKRPESRVGVPLVTEALDGMRFTWAHPALRALLLRSVTAFLAMGFIFPLYLLNAIQIVHLSTAALGVSIALGGAGGVVGASIAGRLSGRFGLGWTFWGTAVLVGCAQLLIPLSSQFPGIGLACLCLQQFVGDMMWTIYIVNETTLRQRLAPEQMIGRVNGAMQLASRGMLPFGALSGGFLAERFGIAWTLWTGALGVLLSCLWLIPLLKRQELRQL